MIQDALLSLSVPFSTTLLIPGIIGSILAFVHFVLFSSLKKKDPSKAQYKTLPGPKGIPWIGPILSLPPFHVYKKFKDWHDEFGPVYQLTLFGTKHIRINDEQIAKEILKKRGAIYSNRAPTPNIPDAKYGAEYLPLLDNNEMMLRHRNFAHQCLSRTYNFDTFGFTHLEIKRMMFQLYKDNRNYPDLAEEFTHRIAARLAWEDPNLSRNLNKSSAGLLKAISPTGVLPNKIPIIMKLPNAINPWYYMERKRHGIQEEFWVGAMQTVKAKMAAGIDGHSWARTFLNEYPKLKFPEVANDKEGAFAVGMLAITMSLPMSSPIQTFFLAMCHYPHWLKKLQQELDLVCGDNRLPTWADAPRLPILRAIGKEIIRWRPPVPTGVPHEAEQDDVYEGFLIEKGTLVHPTEWARRSDEKMYPNPEEFNPARYLDPAYPTYKEPLTKYPNVIDHHVFGYGRRNCMGMEIVDYQLVTIFGSLAWAFDIQKKKNAIGIDIPVHTFDWTDLLITRPHTFVFDIKPRTAQREHMINKMYEDACKADASLAI